MDKGMKSSLAGKLCKNYCRYYKPSKDKGLACKGFLAIERLIGEGREIPFDKAEKGLEVGTEKALIKKICKGCPFFEDGCDFVMKGDGSLPCGGFILLGHLMEKKIIAIDDITNSY